jgi:hypothetical protein
MHELAVAVAENEWAQRCAEKGEEESLDDVPGPIPEDLLHVPGFISKIMDHCFETAPYAPT